MAATVGRLVIDLTANVAQLRTDMQSAAGVVQAVGGQIENAANTAKNALYAMAAALGPAAFVNMISSTITATAELDNLAAKTGASVEALSSIRATASLVGADMNLVAQGLGKLGKTMFEAATGAGKATEFFHLLGVEFQNTDGTLRKVDDTFLDVAVAMSKMEDGATKTALAQIGLGKSGKELIEVLNEIGKAGEYHVKVTTEQAAIAEDFERNLIRAGAAGREMKQIFANEMLPALDTLAKVWLDFQNQAGGLRDIMRALAADGTLKNWALEVGFYLAGIADIVVTAKNMFVAFAETLAQVALVVTAAGEVFKGLAEVMLGGVRDGIQRMASGLLMVQTAWDAFKESWGNVVESTAFRDSFVRNAEAVNNMTGSLRAQAPVLEDTEKKTKAAAKATDEWAAYFKIVWERTLAEEKALKDYNAELAKTIDHANRYIDSLREMTEQSAFEVTQIGLSNEQIRINTALREIDIRTQKQLIPLKDKGLEQLEEEIKKSAEEAKASVIASVMKQKAYQDWLDLMQTATTGVKNFILDFVENGSSAFKNLWNNFKRWALEALAEIAAKQIVVSVVGALGLGGSAGASAAGALGLGSAGNGLSTLLGLGNSASSLAGGGSLLGGVAEGIGSTLFGSVGGGAFATGLTSPLGTITTLLGGSGGATIGAGLGLEAALGAAVPLLGLGLGIASLLGAFDSGGGPMTRNYGLAGGNLSTFSDLSSLHKLVGTDAAQQGNYDAIAQGMLNTYQTVLQQLGVASGANAAFAVYSSQDPQGSALSTVDVRAMLGGQSVYVGNTGETVARTQEALQAEIDRQVTAAILAAISSSGVSQQTILAAYQNLTPAQQAQNQSLYSYLMQSMGPPVAIDNFGLAATPQGAAATTMESAANTIAGAATQLAGASAQMAGAATTYQDATATYYDAAIQRYLQAGMP